jgi:hypothetical protein
LNSFRPHLDRPLRRRTPTGKCPSCPSRQVPLPP